MEVYSITVGFSPTLYCIILYYCVDPVLLPLGNPIKFHEEVLSSLRRFPPKRFDNFPPCLGDAQKVDMRTDFL